MNPMMMPARARPFPRCIPPDCLICDRAMNPKTMASTAVRPKTQSSEQTSEAMARPFVLATGA